MSQVSGRRELRAAGITDPQLQSAYLQCRQLNAEHGRTYFLATRLLPADRRPYVHALYGFARYADEIVDDLSSSLTPQQRAEQLGQWGATMLADLRRGRCEDPIGMAVVDTAAHFEIPIEYFEAFLHSMRMDLTVTDYETFTDLMEYVYGSAAVIGLQMVHVLGTVQASDMPAALERAADLGVAFQMANFIRDVGEDLQRGRVYLPLAELAEFSVTRADLQRQVVTDDVRAALAAQIRRVRELEARAKPGIELLRPEARPCIEAARELYCGIVDAVEAIDYQVFDRRARVGTARRLAVAVPAWCRAVRARR